MNEPSDDLSQIVVTSLREGAVPGTHTVTYESDDDRIELKHTIKTAGHWLWAPSSLRSSSAAKGCLYDGRPAEINDTEHGKIKAFFRNKWVGFTLASILYILWFVLWTGNWWLLLGEIVIFDLYITRYFYKYVWRHNAEMCKKSKSYKAVYEWVNAIIFATVVASLVHIFFFQMYVIPSSSMEKSLLVGDYLYVSKVAYGPQMPNTPVAFPFVHHTMPFSKTKNRSPKASNGLITASRDWAESSATT